ncbi:helix-turn-helix transcriptional regulator [Nitrogeniibacter mangrovi]|uniref:Helix-turn-helix transcriptional regulator n=1 Tax=Nitrogeniibacter mangrovi TaxID=2016596 RepID=A0A6C1B6N3_9RHOO|nr:helix-turn-helix transcriptional regulator [Nitrogeniibacter mangrovi]QID19402.1 helix-turn-helix transcriptional regulator [Nitrogeniibacter mangrovi]
MATEHKNPMKGRNTAVRKAILNPLQRRETRGESQTDFWRRYGVTQSAGSRFESGRPMQSPVQILMALEALGSITSDELDMVVQLLQGVDLPRNGHHSK